MEQLRQSLYVLRHTGVRRALTTWLDVARARARLRRSAAMALRHAGLRRSWNSWRGWSTERRRHSSRRSHTAVVAVRLSRTPAAWPYPKRVRLQRGLRSLAAWVRRRRDGAGRYYWTCSECPGRRSPGASFCRQLRVAALGLAERATRPVARPRTARAQKSSAATSYLYLLIGRG